VCGICGLVNLDGSPVSGEDLRRMTSAIAHRGPDGEGIHLDRNVGLGHRRLAIIDLSDAAAQPMLFRERSLVLTYNGEIYNFQELRGELGALGHRFTTKSDTEVLLRGYAQWGKDIVNRLNGMFAFCILDRVNNELFLARDRYGIKPLYYTFVGNRFLFASEQKAIVASGRYTRALDTKALLEYFTFQNIFTDRTLYEEVRMFPPGHTARLALSPGEQLRMDQYWDFHFQEPECPLRKEEYLEELDHLFTRAVRRHLVSDVEIGAYLSGGVDSGSIVAKTSNFCKYIKTFTCGFDLSSASGIELGFDERHKSEHLSYLFKTEHYEMVLKAGDMERCLDRLTTHIEEPRVGQSYPNFFTAQLASKFCKVVLAGTGGDEIFGGYPWRYYRMNGEQTFEEFIDDYYVFWQRLIANRDLCHVFAPIWDQVRDVWTRDIFRDVLKGTHSTLTRPEDYVHYSMAFEAKTFLHGLLTVEDKLSMAHGLECRVPFLDNDLVDFACRLPARHKLGNLEQVQRINENEQGKRIKHFNRTKEGKILFREYTRSFMPDEVSSRTKQGFSAPDASWFKGESIDFVRNLLYDPRARIFAYLDPKSIQAMVNQHLEGKENRRLLIWSLIQFEYWLKTHLEN
jgi:asparagine synthase (glutamine-hydrolysing)